MTDSWPTEDIDNAERLHRRIHPAFKKNDGSISSQAFTDPELSVDRANFRTIEESVSDYPLFGLAGLQTLSARNLDLEVKADFEMFNPAHALIKGKKTKSICRQLANASSWVIPLGIESVDV